MALILLVQLYQNWYSLRDRRHVKRLPAAFFQLSSGWEPIREWLKSLEEEDRKVIGEDIKDVEFFLADRDAVMPFAWQRPLGVRSDLAGGRIAQVIFCIANSQMVLLHGFIKKTQKTPQADLELALKRKKDIA
jgi:phage-related protein